MMPTIRIDDEVMKALQKKAVPLVDTPNTVLRRLLGLSKQSRRSRLVMAKRVPETAPGESVGRPPTAGKQFATALNRTQPAQYRRPMLEALYELGGSSRVGDVLALVESKVKAVLTKDDQGILRSGEVRWRNAAMWERFALVQEGLLKSTSPRGLWELTGAGVAEVEAQSRPK